MDLEHHSIRSYRTPSRWSLPGFALCSAFFGFEKVYTIKFIKHRPGGANAHFPGRETADSEAHGSQKESTSSAPRSAKERVQSCAKKCSADAAAVRCKTFKGCEGACARAKERRATVIPAARRPEPTVQARVDQNPELPLLRLRRRVRGVDSLEHRW